MIETRTILFGGVASAWRPVALGAVTAGLAYAAHRIQSAQFPLDMLTVELIVLPLGGLALGLVRGERWFGGMRGTRRALILLLAFLGSMAMNRGVSLHYFVSEAYYPYPKPDHPWLRLVAFGLSWVAEVGLFAWLGRAWRQAAAARASLGLGLLGAALGIGLSAHAILAVGPQPVLAAWLALGAFLALPALAGVAIAVAGVAIVAVGLRTPYAFHTWRAVPQDYELLEQQWTPYYFLSFISLQNDRCLGGVYSYLMLWQVCDEPSLLQREFRYFHGTLGRGKHSMLGIGRVDGTTALTLAEPSAPLERVTLVETDPVVAERLNGTLARYNGALAQRPDYRILSGDWRTILENDDQRYDVVALDGLGIALYTIPLTNVPHEGWLFTREAFRTIFDERLEKDGVLVINWGSTREHEVYPLVANLPDDVAKAAFWITFSEYPFSGLPLFLIAASRDHERIAELRAALEGVPPFKEVPIPADLSAWQFTDDSPLVQRAVYRDGLFFVTPLHLLLVAGLVILWRRSRRKGLVDGGTGALAALTGASLAVGLAWLVARHARIAIPSGAALGAVLLGCAWLVGAALGWLAAPRLGPGIAAFGPLAAAAGVLALFLLHHPGTIVLVSAALWLGFTGFLALHASVSPTRDTPRALALMVLGVTLGLIAHQDLLLFGSFSTIAAVLAVVCTATTCWLALRARHFALRPAVVGTASVVPG